MKKIQLILFWCFLSFAFANGQSNIEYTPYIQSGGMYFASDHITSAGLGTGIGLCIGIGNELLLQSDANIYWMNGNAGNLRLGIGYKKTGFWAPAVYIFGLTIFGSRTEILLENGSRPTNPEFSIGMRLSPLRFENEKGFVSALEPGYGIGRYQGKYFEISILAIGIKFN